MSINRIHKHDENGSNCPTFNKLVNNYVNYIYDYYSYKIKIRQKINERREKRRRNIKRVHSHPNSCHLHGCIVPCPPTCTYYQEQRRLRLYGWEEIKL